MDVIETTDYDIFKGIVGNRKVEKKHVEMLTGAIDRNNLLNVRPIIVNEEMMVIDGQHRLEAAKLLEVPIFYYIVKGAGHQEVALLNSNQRNWIMSDYLNMYAKQGYPEYIKLKEFLENHKIDLQHIFMVLTLGIESCSAEERIRMARINTNFRNGFFVAKTDYQQLGQYIDKFLEFKKEFLKYSMAKRGECIFLKSSGIARAFFLFCETFWEKIRWPVFFKHVSENTQSIVAKSTRDQYYQLLLSIYNFRLPNKNCLK